MIRLVIADGYDIVREGIAACLRGEPAIEVAGEARCGTSTLDIVGETEPDILLMDLGLADPCGLDVLRQLRRSGSAAKSVVVSADARVSDVFTALALGAKGFLPKQSGTGEIIAAIRAVGCGYAIVPCDYIAEFVTLRQNIARYGNIFGLSRREVQIVKTCARGMSTREIAERLSISARTVETHRTAIYRKMSTRRLDEIAEMIRLF